MNTSQASYEQVIHDWIVQQIQAQSVVRASAERVATADPRVDASSMLRYRSTRPRTRGEELLPAIDAALAAAPSRSS
jgi:hypothetical protein